MIDSRSHPHPHPARVGHVHIRESKATLTIQMNDDDDGPADTTNRMTSAIFMSNKQVRHPSLAFYMEIYNVFQSPDPRTFISIKA